MEAQVVKKYIDRCWVWNHWIQFILEVSWDTQTRQILWWRTRKGVYLPDKCFHLTAPEIANLYKNRWQIELFFKWLKQHLKIKKFWGTTENAARIQISSAIIAYCPVAIVQHDLLLKRSTYEALQILSISLMDKTPLVDFFERTDFNNVKELDCPLFPGLFD